MQFERGELCFFTSQLKVRSFHPACSIRHMFAYLYFETNGTAKAIEENYPEQGIKRPDF